MNKLVKKGITVAAICLSLSTTAFAEQIQDSQGNIIEVIAQKEHDIDWEKPYISFQLVDEAKFEAFVAGGKYDASEILNHGISGDFISVSQQRIGHIKTETGTYTITSVTNEDGSRYIVLCNDEKSDICKPVYLKQVDKKYLLYGQFGEILKKYRMMDFNSNDFVGISYVDKNDFFKNIPRFDIKRYVKSTKMTQIHWEDTVIDNNDGSSMIKGYIDNPDKTVIYLRQSGEQKALTLEDGTRVFTRSTADKDVNVLFYMDFDNNKNPYEVSFVDICLIKAEDVQKNFNADKKDLLK